MYLWLEKPGDREGPSPPGPIEFISWRGPRGTQYITKMGPFTSLSCFSAIAIDTLVVLGPWRHLGALFLEGPQGLVPSTSGIISPAQHVSDLAVLCFRRVCVTVTRLRPSAPSLGSCGEDRPVMSSGRTTALTASSASRQVGTHCHLSHYRSHYHISHNRLHHTDRSHRHILSKLSSFSTDKCS